MKKQYTKQQIVEAIKHWESILKRMDESKSPLLDEFAKMFGEDVVKSIPKSQTPSQSDDKAVDLALKSLKESENGMPCIIDENTANVQLVGNRRYIVISFS